jgi:hypothetical protein
MPPSGWIAAGMTDRGRTFASAVSGYSVAAFAVHVSQPHKNLHVGGTADITGNTKITGTVDITGDFSAANGAFSGTLTKGGANVATDASDRRLKRNISRISSTSALDTIKALEGVSFRFRTEEFPAKRLDAKEQVGFIAQDVEGILPQVVNAFDDGYKGIEYGKVTAVLVEAVKQQADEIERLRAQVDEVRGALQQLQQKGK